MKKMRRLLKRITKDFITIVLPIIIGAFIGVTLTKNRNTLIKKPKKVITVPVEISYLESDTLGVTPYNIQESDLITSLNNFYNNKEVKVRFKLLNKTLNRNTVVDTLMYQIRPDYHPYYQNIFSGILSPKVKKKGVLRILIKCREEFSPILGMGWDGVVLISEEGCGISTLIHEVGHSFGLLHYIQSKENIMYPYYSPDRVDLTPTQKELFREGVERFLEK